MEKLLKLIWLSDYNLLLLLNVDANDTASRYLDSIKSDYRALRVGVMGMGTQEVISILLVRGKRVRRTSQ